MSDCVSEKLKAFFKAHLPITQFMELEVERYDGQTLVLKAPLEPNINDKQTAFGGSLYNACVMACWGMLYLKTQEKGVICNQVVTKGSIEYKAPVTGEIRAICTSPNEEDLNRFFQHFNEKGKARMSLNSLIHCDGKSAVEFEGTYAILREE